MKCIVLKHHSNTIVLFHKQEAKNNKIKFIYDSFETHLHTIELNLGRREQINIASVIVQDKNSAKNTLSEARQYELLVSELLAFHI